MNDWEKRFWEKVKILSKNACWEWQAGKFHYGHGQFSLKRKNFKAHRISYILTKGSIPNGKCVLHKCDNPPCCNPSHLYVGTQKDNAQDRKKRGRQNSQKGSKHSQCIFDEKIVLKIRKSFSGKRGEYGSIAKKYGVDRKTIFNLITKRSWNHI